MQADLLSLFRAKRAELSTKGLAEELGIKADLVRLIATGHHPNPNKHLSAFARHFAVGGVYCPHKQAYVGHDDCRQRSTAPRPFGGAARLAWWEACQGCENKEKDINTKTPEKPNELPNE